MKRLLGLALFAVLATGAVSCSDSTGPGDALAGTYSLRSVNNTALPVRICDVSCYDVLSGEILLESNGRYSSITRYSDGNEPADGTWSLTGNTLTLTDSFDGFQTFATVSGDQLILSIPTSGGSLTAVYSR